MITAEEAIRTARERMGTAYADMDCIALIRDVIRRGEGGEPGYRCEGTNWLWRSIINAKKYRHLIWRQEGVKGAAAGMLAFKRKGDDVHHVGLVTDEGTVIHASSVSGCVVETPLDGSWHALGQHRSICTWQKTDAEEENGGEAALQITIIDSAGRRFMPAGDWRVLVGSVD